MARIRASVEIDATPGDAYLEWEQFESFPTFMRSVRAVERIDERRSQWRLEIFGYEETWIAETTERIPGQLHAWRGLSGAMRSGSISFAPLGTAAVRATLQLEYSPTSSSGSVADWLGVFSRRIEAELYRFARHVEHGGARAPLPPEELLVGQ